MTLKHEKLLKELLYGNSADPDIKFELNIHLSSDHCTVGSSILFITTTNFLTPAVLTNMACSRVWPPRSKPVSNSPFLADITYKIIPYVKTMFHTQKKDKKDEFSQFSLFETCVLLIRCIST